MTTRTRSARSATFTVAAAAMCLLGLTALPQALGTAPGTCEHSVAFFTNLAQCPEACKDGDDELDAGETRCKAGESPRSPSVCGETAAPGCGAALTAMSKEDMGKVVAGFGTCTGQFASFANLGLGASHLTGQIKSTASKCGYAADILDPKIFVNTATPGTCEHSVGFMSEFAQCPEACKDGDDELDAGETRCEAGESPRSPAVCGATAAPGCGAALTRMSKADLGKVAAGFGTCTGQYASFANLGLGADYLGLAIKDAATKCGYADTILDPSISPKAGTCFHSVSVISGFDQCPEACKDEDDELEAGERHCNAGESPRSPSVCGVTAAPDCGAALTAMSREDMAKVIAGFGTCTGQFAAAAAYAAYGASYLKVAVRDAASECGYADDILDPKTFVNAATLGTCEHSVVEVLSFASACPEVCKDDDDELEAGERRCNAGESRYSPASCGATAAPGCAAAITSMSKQDLDSVSSGLKQCTGVFADFQQYGFYGGQYIRSVVLKEAQKECGYAVTVLATGAGPASAKEVAIFESVEKLASAGTAPSLEKLVEVIGAEADQDTEVTASTLVADVQNARLRERIAKLEKQVAELTVSSKNAASTTQIGAASQKIDLLKVALAADDKTALDAQTTEALKQEKLTSTDVTQGINDGSITPFAVAGASVGASRAGATTAAPASSSAAAVKTSIAVVYVLALLSSSV